MPIYNKLVRDHIPQVIAKDGKTCTTRILGDKEYIQELKKKSQEELTEYLQAADDSSALEELADLLEILHALAKCHGADVEEVERIRQRKAEERGGFAEKIFLIEVKDA
ncbi:nucleoside triphosphate pyrophosphohydrolase [Ectobacillus ponti]|uniref:Nucleoside triphosphate pyrophosphohydrolase n=1 Tax=Ectobacillus ponti TaxID=2961894 RepID=A0AA42BUT1_9BACI|nr:nucleoside triphosphate pyrophosphohydrolase [Ectobacillus ponti]MCP8970843.1 nucleoside triphosphate pyrophosphohydrolase [Ectobacillus ponti]